MIASLDTSMQRGFVYVAWGDEFVEEARESARRLKIHHDYKIVLITAGEIEQAEPFDLVITTKFSSSYKDKILMELSPFEHSIFLDTDTKVLAPLDELFELLARFDIIYQAIAPSNHYTIEGMPILAFYEPSAGLVAWKKNIRTLEFFERWRTDYEFQQQQNGDGAWDQRSMRSALWRSNVQLYTLGQDWQLYSFEPGICMNKVRMIHGRGKQAFAAYRQCNNMMGPRIYIPEIGFTSVRGKSPKQMFKLGFISIYLAARRSLRLMLHWVGIWRLPQDLRPM